MKIGKMIVKGRKEKNISQEKLAEKMGITRQTLSNYENGITSPDLEQTKKICEILEISMDELVGNNNTISSKVSNTERLVKKQNKSMRVILITLYIIIMTFLIIFTVHYLTKRDFTDKYQMEIECYKKDNKKVGFEITVDSNPLINFDKEHQTASSDINYDNQDYSDYVYGDYVLNVCEYDGKFDGCQNMRMYAGKSLVDAVNAVNIMKNYFLSQGYICS